MTIDDRTDTDVVHCADVNRLYASGVAAVRDVTCRVPPAARIALTGRSGSGKSTLLHLIAGLDIPTSGTVRWPALSIGQCGRPAGVGVVFQGTSLLDDLDVVENVCLPMLFEGISATDAHRRAHLALAEVDIAELADCLPEDLSSGQAQRVAVARVLAGRPQLILADEPTGRLDRRTGERVITALLAAADSTGAAIIIATHDDAVAARLTSRWTMRDGRLDYAS
ncbi:ABC transporter ATP-binding protein [Mycobacterium sp. ENV421]|uniref:ABC transporter ATP-binding protein n=1 Tax=Mycobacterium sp. ENV421 TaxID=1213407 RepID=UPI000C9B14FD|nr:ABC transporter ATP-binding protein [Mycobacterium sp. ENV421]PND57253.1 ABC transporter ATP-binding protein [Mycobacterium sp. ENV421]